MNSLNFKKKTISVFNKVMLHLIKVTYFQTRDNERKGLFNNLKYMFVFYGRGKRGQLLTVFFSENINIKLDHHIDKVTLTGKSQNALVPSKLISLLVIIPQHENRNKARSNNLSGVTLVLKHITEATKRLRWAYLVKAA